MQMAVLFTIIKLAMNQYLTETNATTDNKVHSPLRGL